ncbi:PEP-CTERM sorting domain-containing protein [Crocosphaera sp.]|uniref:PEP-CTERM sorting domain-containing protein n=1 Tax=Crocosphaera sp. TaxID=2729996 RepID=UPI00261FCECE|nr:PEP-CTERM sorting domain-containing protein [Crocosphaera sp.]MDJ0581259.1 PEP-CTERM sorting domain-containing protein [Crocosphaera sp.]
MNKTTLTALTVLGVSATSLLISNSAQAALFFNVTEDGGNTTVTLTGIDFTTSGLTPDFVTSIVDTSITPSSGSITYSGATDTFIPLDGPAFIIPTFSFGTGSVESSAFDLSSSNPFINLDGQLGNIYSRASSPIPSDFVATATYAGTIADLGIDTTPQTITWSNGQEFRLFQPVPSASTPEPGTILGLLAFGSMGALARKRK